MRSSFCLYARRAVRSEPERVAHLVVQEDFYILFSELKQRTYTLYRFQRAAALCGQTAVTRRPVGAAIAEAAATAMSLAPAPKGE